MKRNTLLPSLVLLLTVGLPPAAVTVAAQEAPTAPEKKPEQEQEGVASIDEAVKRGVAFLLKSQNKDGSWGTGRQTRGTEVYSMVPGSHDAFRVATTALAVMALREAGEQEAHRRGVEYLVRHGQARRDAGPLMYNIWAHTYSLHALAIEMRHNKDPRLKTAAEWQLDRLKRYETFIGGWNYYDFEAGTQRPAMGPTSFGTAAGLVALWEAKQSGIDVPLKMIDSALRRLAEMRLPNGAYLYASSHKYHPRHPANRPRGSVGRSQSGNYALWLWSDKAVGEKQVHDGLEMFFKEHDYINMGRRRPYPHESWYATAPYYYYFGHYYTARLVEKLGPAGREKYGAKLAETILPHQEPDGSWWDYAMWDYHKPYGTAFSIMTLLRCK